MYNWRVVFPIISGYFFSIICRIKLNEGSLLPQRPPSWVFKIVWPVLYIFLGFSWENSYKKFIYIFFIFFILIFLLILWQLFYSCLKNKKFGVYIIALTIAVNILLLTINITLKSKALIIPLLAWLLIAFNLNWNLIK